MKKSKYDYDSESFYKMILILASKGYTDKEISLIIEINPTVFATMKNGNYRGWSKENNLVRSEKIRQTLDKGRCEINALVRQTILNLALGGIVTRKEFSRKYGIIDGEMHLIITEIKENLPNLNALMTWLFNNDQEWKRRCMNKVSEVEKEQDDFVTKMLKSK